MVREAHIRGALRLLTALALMLAAAVASAAAPVSTVARSAAAVCLADPAPGTDPTRQPIPATAWTCDPANWATHRERAVLRYQLEDGRVPDRISTRLARFQAIRVGVVHPNRPVAWHDLAITQFKPYGHMTMAAPLPEAGARAAAVLVDFDGPTVTGQLIATQLTSGPEESFREDEIYLAALCGLMIAPLLFSIAFYRVLRESFLLWHGVVVGFMLTQIVVTSGLARYIGAIPADIASYLAVTTFCGGTAAAAMLARQFIEHDRLDPVHRKALVLVAAGMMANCAVFVVLVDHFQQLAVQIYYIGWLPLIGAASWVLATAARRGSRAVWFQILAWTPMIASGLTRITANTFDLGEPLVVFRFQDLAIALEVVVISLGIIDRFVGLRRDLDRQLLRATKLERLAERDPLTGLMNRRAIEPHFARLRSDGFSTFAVVDLDMFKDINDRFGHTVGDRVLQAAARALAPSGDMLSMRLGGEEFVLLLRGRNAVRHAEWCRRALSNRISAEVEGLDRIVTASMGLVEIPEDVMPDATFGSIYARADALLYQAKRTGRNRTVSERIASFAHGPATSRGHEAAA